MYIQPIFVEFTYRSFKSVKLIQYQKDLLNKNIELKT